MACMVLRGCVTYPCEQSQERHIPIAIAAGGNADGRDDDKDQLDAIESSPPVAIC
jgi:hypothetical protein